MKSISSTSNETVKHIVKLQQKSYRHQHQQFIAQGATVCSTLIKQGYELVDLYLTEEALHKYSSTFTNISITMISNPVLKKISTSSSPSGVVAIFKIPTTQANPSENAIVLYDIQDPGNMGTLIRTAAAMNIAHIYLIDGADPYGPKVIQATAGTIAYLNIISIRWSDFIKKHANIPTVALVVDNGSTPNKLNLSKSILIIGNEGQGLPQHVIDQSTEKMTIPMPGNTESLNAAVAGSIAMYLKSQK